MASNLRQHSLCVATCVQKVGPETHPAGDLSDPRGATSCAPQNTSIRDSECVFLYQLIVSLCLDVVSLIKLYAIFMGTCAAFTFPDFVG